MTDPPSPIELARRAIELEPKLPGLPWRFAPGFFADQADEWIEPSVMVPSEIEEEESCLDILSTSLKVAVTHESVGEWIVFARTALPALARAVMAQDEEIKTLLALFPAPEAGKGEMA